MRLRVSVVQEGLTSKMETATQVQLRSKDLLAIEDLSREEIELILDTAESFKEVSTRPIKKVPALRGRTIVNLFFEPSTRTRTSFELAAKRLSADTVNVSVGTSAVAKGECLRDTVRTIEAMATDLLVVRHSSAGVPRILAGFLDCSVVNAGDGSHEHPTQALLDLYTIRERAGRLKGLKVAIVGDIAHSRVARSNILGFTRMGADVVVVGPPTLMPVEVESLGVKVEHHLDAVIPDVDIIYVLRIQLERQKQNLFPSVREYAALYGVNRERLERAKPGVLVLHPGPMNRGVEIASDVADLPQALIMEQVANGIAVRMAVLYLLLGGSAVS